MKRPDCITENVSLQGLTTLRIGGEARFLARPQDVESLTNVMAWAQSQSLPLFYLGKGSNTLFADDGFDGCVISLRTFENNILQVRDQILEVSSGLGLTEVASRLAEQGWGGLEFVNTIPGTVGGALAMNAGFSRIPGKKREISEKLLEVQVLEDGKTKWIGSDQIQFSYRQSSLRGKLIVRARFKVTPHARILLLEELRANFEYRQRVQDLSLPSAGSLFKNPSSSALSAGLLLERSGLRGFSVGDAILSMRHANYLLNKGKATSVDVCKLIDICRERVLERFQIELEPELCVVKSAEPIGHAIG